MSLTVESLVVRVRLLVQIDKQTVKDIMDVIQYNGIPAALEEYGRHFPRKLTMTQAGDDSRRNFDLPSTFKDDFSVITDVEYPVNTDTDEDKQFLTKKDWMVYPNDYTTIQIQFLGMAPASTESFKVFFTAEHLADLSTIPTFREQAFTYLCAAKTCEILDAALVEFQDSTLDADTVESGGVATSWRTKADRFRALYNQIIGPADPDSLRGAVAIQDLDSGFAGTRPRIFHRD